MAPRPSVLKQRAARQARMGEANRLIEIIAAHGRKFFRHEERAAHFSVDGRNHVWFVDDYTWRPVYIQRNAFGDGWRNFSHGGTLKRLVEKLRDHISRAEPVPLSMIAPSQWGYDEEAMAKVREEASKLEMFKGERN